MTPIQAQEMKDNLHNSTAQLVHEIVNQNMANHAQEMVNGIGGLLEQTVSKIRAPRKIVRDANGRAQGIE